jgi:hypothetical protein
MAQLSIDSPMRADLPIYPSLPFNVKVCEALSKVSAMFNDLAMQGDLSVQTIEILANLSVQARGDGSSSPPTSPPGSPGGRHLLNTIADVRCILSMSTTDIEHVLCYGIIGTCFSLHFANKSIGDDFNDTLQIVEDGICTTDPNKLPKSKAPVRDKECYIWVSVAAAGAFAQSEVFSAMSMVFDQALDRFPEEIGRWDTLEKILRKFLWNDTLGAHWKQCWRKLMSRRMKAR